MDYFLPTFSPLFLSILLSLPPSPTSLPLFFHSVFLSLLSPSSAPFLPLSPSLLPSPSALVTLSLPHSDVGGAHCGASGPALTPDVRPGHVRRLQQQGTGTSKLSLCTSQVRVCMCVHVHVCACACVCICMCVHVNVCALLVHKSQDLGFHYSFFSFSEILFFLTQLNLGFVVAVIPSTKNWTLK